MGAEAGRSSSRSGRRIKAAPRAGKPRGRPAQFLRSARPFPYGNVEQSHFHPLAAAPMVQRGCPARCSPLAARRQERRAERLLRRAKGRRSIRRRRPPGPATQMVGAEWRHIDDPVLRQDEHRLRIAGAERPRLFDLLDQVRRWRRRRVSKPSTASARRARAAATGLPSSPSRKAAKSSSCRARHRDAGRHGVAAALDEQCRARPPRGRSLPRSTPAIERAEPVPIVAVEGDGEGRAAEIVP